MKTIKIIDLFNKIANKEELPKKIKYKGFIYTFREKSVNSFDYQDDDTDYLIEKLCDSLYINELLECEVEIIEEEKEIEKIGLDDFCDITYRMDWELLKNDFNKNTNTFVNKINELIDAVNELKRNK